MFAAVFLKEAALESLENVINVCEEIMMKILLANLLTENCNLIKVVVFHRINYTS